MIRSTVFSLALCIAFASQSRALTYWVDSVSCTGQRSLTLALEETKLMGLRASERLNSNTDTDYQHVYEFLMKRKKSDHAELNQIEGFMSDVGKMTLENDRNAANIRIYCDDEKRWKARVDPKTGQNTGGWEDPENWVLQPARSIWSRPGCHDTRGGKRFTYAQTYRIYMDGEPSQKQAELRAAITMCELGLFNEDGSARRVLSQIPANIDISKAKRGIEAISLHPSKSILHELSHFHGYDTIDNAYFLSNPISSKNIRSLNAAELMKNADVRSYLGQLAILADRGVTFQRKPLDSASEHEKAEFNMNMEMGKLFLYPNLTKRGLRRTRRYARS